MQNFMKTILSAVQTWTKGKIKDSTADWNQNDSSADNYVKNRPFYEEKVEKEVLFFPETTFTPSYEEEDGYYGLSIPCNSVLVIGQRYTVTLNGDVFADLICFDNEGTPAIGASYGDFSEYHFHIVTLGAVSSLYFITDLEGEYTLSISTYSTETTVYKLDHKYIPDDVGMQADWNETDVDSKAYILNKPNPNVPKDCLVLKDLVDGYNYRVQMQKGTLSSDLTGTTDDFTYAINPDGTYTVAGWNQTFYGEPSTEMYVPDCVSTHEQFYFNSYPSVTKCVIPDSVNLHTKELYQTFYNMQNLKEVAVPNYATRMYQTFRNCTNLTTAVCGPSVTRMEYTYNNCTNLTTAVCGPNVTSIYGAYENCTNLITAVCGDSVQQMEMAYFKCSNLTTPVCGDNVQQMGYAFAHCTNLTTAVCGPNVIGIGYAYYNCPNISGNVYFYSNSITNVRNCFYGHNTSNRLNIYVHAGTTTNTYIHRSNVQSLVGATVTWTNKGTYQYNATRNIYIYPVANVEEARIANGD